MDFCYPCEILHLLCHSPLLSSVCEVLLYLVLLVASETRFSFLTSLLFSQVTDFLQNLFQMLLNLSLNSTPHIYLPVSKVTNFR